MNKLTKAESLALQAMIERVGFGPVLDDLAMLASEKPGDESWDEISSQLTELSRITWEAGR